MALDPPPHRHRCHTFILHIPEHCTRLSSYVTPLCWLTTWVTPDGAFWQFSLPARNHPLQAILARTAHSGLLLPKLDKLDSCLAKVPPLLTSHFSLLTSVYSFSQLATHSPGLLDRNLMDCNPLVRMVDSALQLFKRLVVKTSKPCSPRATDQPWLTELRPGTPLPAVPCHRCVGCWGSLVGSTCGSQLFHSLLVT